MLDMEFELAAESLVQSRTAFISGHLDLTYAEFMTHYIRDIWRALVRGDSFIVGDAGGCDKLAQEELSKYVNGVMVYHMFDAPRNNTGNFPTVGGFESDSERDAAMIAASDYDIAWVRPGREKSGTAKNLKRRIQHEAK